MSHESLVQKLRETRRTHKVSVNDYVVINLEYFNLLRENAKRRFSLYLLLGDEVFEFMEAQENSSELWNELIVVLRNRFSKFTLVILRRDIESYFSFLDVSRAQMLEPYVKLLGRKNGSIFNALLQAGKASQRIAKDCFDRNALKQALDTATFFKTLSVGELEKVFFAASKIILENPGLYDHTASVTIVTSFVSKLLHEGFPVDQNEIVQSAIYHDLGKSCVEPHILNKPGMFTATEFEQMKQHTVFGYELLRDRSDSGFEIPECCFDVCLEHHEKFMGGGYPNNKRGRREKDPKNGIHLYSRIVKIADVYSALLKKRIYHPSFEPHDALIFMSDISQEEYDGDIFIPFVKKAVKVLNDHASEFNNRRLEIHSEHIVLERRSS